MSFVRCFPLLLAVASFALARPAHAKPPHVVVILADDQGWGDLSLSGNQNLATPRIDSLSRDGALLQQFFVCPVCSPTRAEFLTGRWHPRGGVRGVSTGGERLDLDETTIGQVFQAAGYATGLFGKWHNGSQWPYHPCARGFSEFHGFTSGHWGHYFDPILEHNGRIVRARGYIADIFTDRALEFIAAHRNQPFFCYLALNTPHSPMQVPQRFYRKFADAPLPTRHHQTELEDLAMTRAALAMVENMDWNVGRVLDKLDELRLADDTIIVYFSDNGPNSWRFNGGFRGRKGSTDEGGVRSPCFIRWPGTIPPGTRVASIAAAIDLLPTLADLAGVPLNVDKPLDGISLAPQLRGETTGDQDRMIFSHWAGKVSVRTRQYRLDDAGRLYDMKNDPGQTRDISPQQPETADRLRQAVAAWKVEMLPLLGADDRPFPVGYPEFPITYLPARDAVPHGTIQRSAPAPNCSYLRHWTSTDDAVTWDVEIATAGRYEATIFYTCHPQNVGAVLELSLGERRLRATVTQPHDPLPVGAREDRVRRQSESYVKDFRPLKLGEVDLDAGRGQLALRAVSIPGSEAIELRAIALRIQTPKRSSARSIREEFHSSLRRD
jgi:arylsulfatase A-like enzyme